MLEEQANAIPDTKDPKDAKFKAQQLDRAKAFYQQLVKDFPNSPYVPKAKERLAALGVK